ncbi:hypothetical protein TNCV_3949631 [Trichonephila clavipes]|nr:hypothetical protein TNCV_3949631 [Trichonephila clavipes]
MLRCRSRRLTMVQIERECALYTWYKNENFKKKNRANCARDFMKKADISKWDGIVVVSGDGLLFERPDYMLRFDNSAPVECCGILENGEIRHKDFPFVTCLYIYSDSRRAAT